MRFFKRSEPEESGPELGASEELEVLSRRVADSAMPPLVRDASTKEMERLTKIHPDSSEYTIGITYLAYLLSMPWRTRTEDNLDIRRAGIVLDEDHFALPEIKERILEYLAVRKLRTERRPNLLVVEDEEITRKNLVRVLTREGYDAQAASNGMEALSRLREHVFDVMITDLKMDQLDGIELLKRTRETHPDVSVIIITGYATVDSAVEAMKVGAADYIAKPFQLDDVRSAVRGVLERKRFDHEMQGPVLCFVGPPGTGKTSLGRSVARALERRFVRISLAGMKDEAEIRGHRRTYSGALPGRIIQEIRRVGCVNPVFMMDEVDKLGREFKGDPAAALLEVLDPEQNRRFMDYYLDVPFDLSQVMFILTANITDPIPGPLLDRMEILPFSGYTDEEKVQIAARYLAPRQVSENGLEDFAPEFKPEALHRIIREYTREAGLRELERQIAAVCRKIAREFVLNDTERRSLSVGSEDIPDFLGPRKYYEEIAEARDRVGVATGLVRTESGGSIMFIEATIMKGRGNLILTGSLGEVMRESAQAALSHIRSNAERFHISEDRFLENDVHVHVPAGAVPKDGPSAGLTIAVALLSVFTGSPASRKVACTGEITLTGRILPVAGLREKILAAKRAKVETVILPERNRTDVEVLPERIRSDIRFLLVDSLEEAMKEAVPGLYVTDS
jgi:ATP-dependent Lon protease